MGGGLGKSLCHQPGLKDILAETDLASLKQSLAALSRRRP